MRKLATTKMSSKGQVVIPEEIRNQLKLMPGEQFVVVGEKDMVMLKVISQPSMDDFDKLVKIARAQAREAGLTKADVKAAVKEARRQK